MASVGFGNTAGEIFERGAPYLGRALQDLVPTSELLDEYSPELFCTIRNLTTSRPRSRLAGGERLFAADPRRNHGRGQPVRLPRQPAAGERPRRSGGQAGLLAAHHS